MNVTKSAKTRFQDWQDRRKYLLTQASADPRNVLQIKLLDFLISRYRDSAAAHQPARFDSRRALHWNDRRITVHHHLAGGNVGRVQNREDAQRRIAVLLQRMMSDEPREDDSEVLTNLTAEPRYPIVNHNLDWQVKLGLNTDFLMRQALVVCPILSDTCLQHLISRLTDVTHEDSMALDLFLRCENRNMLTLTVRVWRERVAKERLTSWITEELAARIRQSDHQPRAAELIRERLADDNAHVRVAASRLMAQIGDLDDIALMSDLLALPLSSDEDPSERDTLMAAMKTIAERLA